MSYAEGTSVSVERSKAEIDALLAKHGAAQRLMGADDERGEAYVLFTIAGRQVRLHIPLPKLGDFAIPERPRDWAKRTAGLQRQWEETQRERRAKAYEQACRERWRAMLLLIKAKLEAIALGISTAEREFLADIALPDGRTVHSFLEEGLRQAYAGGTTPPLLGPGA